MLLIPYHDHLTLPQLDADLSSFHMSLRSGSNKALGTLLTPAWRDCTASLANRQSGRPTSWHPAPRRYGLDSPALVAESMPSSLDNGDTCGDALPQWPAMHENQNDEDGSTTETL